MTFPGITARTTAIACLILAVVLLALVGLFAPTRPPRDATPTPIERGPSR
jgi:hypothetical protein